MASRKPICQKEEALEAMLDILTDYPSTAKEERDFSGVSVNNLPELSDASTAQWSIVGKNNDLYKLAYAVDDSVNVLRAAIENGNQFVNAGSIGCDTVVGGGDVNQEKFCSWPSIIVTPGTNASIIVSMGEIATFSSKEITSTQVREGCLIHVTNKGAGNAVLTPPAGTGIFLASSTATDPFTIPGGYGVTLFPALYASGAKVYIILSIHKCNALPGGEVDNNISKTYVSVDAAKAETHTAEVKLINITNTDARFVPLTAYWDGRYPDYAKFTDASGIVWGLVFTEYVDATWLGAVGDGTTDCTDALTNTLALSSMFGKTAYLPSAKNHYLVTREVIGKVPYSVDFRGEIIGADTMAADEPVLTLAANSYREDLSNKIYVYGVDRADKVILNPCLRLIGMKTWNIEIGLTRKIEFMAMVGQAYVDKYQSTDPGLVSIRSFGYNQIQIGRAYRLELVNDDAQCWVNENTFVLNRIFGGKDCGIFFTGPYESNHNLFTRGCMEGEFEINIENGSSNRFKEVRFERYPDRVEKLKIVFGKNTWDNTIESTWQSYPGVWNGPYESANALVEIIDQGILNSVNAGEQIDNIDYPILELTKTCNLSSTGSLTSYSNVYNLTQDLSGKFNIAANWRLIYSNLSKPIPVTVGDAFSLQSDAAVWRYSLVCFDEHDNVITTEPVGFIAKGDWKWDAALGGFSPGNASISNTQFCLGELTTVKGIAFVVRASNNAAGTWFEELCITKRSARKPVYGALDSENSYSEANQRSNILSVTSLSTVDWLNIRPGASIFFQGKLISKSWERVCSVTEVAASGAKVIKLLTYQPIPTEDTATRQLCINGTDEKHAIASITHSGFISTITLKTALAAEVPVGTLISVFSLATVESSVDLPPLSAANADKYVVINAAGNGFTTSTETVTEISGVLTNMVEGVQNGNQLLNVKCLGADTRLTADEITQVDFCKSNIIIGIPTSGQTKVVNMGDIAPYQATTLTDTQVREGCQIKIVNKGAGTMTLTPPDGIKLFTSSSTATTYNLAGEKYVEVFPAVYDDGDKKYILVGTGPAH